MVTRLLFSDLISGAPLGELPYSALSFADSVNDAGDFGASVDLDEVLRPALGADYSALVADLGATNHWPLNDAVKTDEAPAADVVGDAAGEYIRSASEATDVPYAFGQGMRNGTTVEFVGAAVTTTQFAGQVIIPADAQGGDFALAWASAGTNNDWVESPVTPAGWTLEYSDARAGDGIHMMCWSKVLVGADAGSAVVFKNSVKTHGANVAVFRNVLSFAVGPATFHKDAATDDLTIAGAGGQGGGMLLTAMCGDEGRFWQPPTGSERVDSYGGWPWSIASGGNGRFYRSIGISRRTLREHDAGDQVWAATPGPYESASTGRAIVLVAENFGHGVSLPAPWPGGVAPFTASFWAQVKTHQKGLNGRLSGFYAKSIYGDSSAFELVDETDGWKVRRKRQSDEADLAVELNQPHLYAQWKHLVIRFDGVNLQLFENGQLLIDADASEWPVGELGGVARWALGGRIYEPADVVSVSAGESSEAAQSGLITLPAGSGDDLLVAVVTGASANATVGGESGTSAATYPGWTILVNKFAGAFSPHLVVMTRTPPSTPEQLDLSTGIAGFATGVSQIFHNVQGASVVDSSAQYST